MVIRQLNIFRILNANLILAVPFIIGISCNLSVDCRIEKTAINSPFCEVPIPALLWIVLIVWTWILIKIINKHGGSDGTRTRDLLRDRQAL